MKQEEKELILNDLCAMLPYGAFVQFEVDGQKTIKPLTVDFFSCTWYHTEYIKPYLRPMDTMTKDEQKELTEFMNEVKCTDEGIFLPGNDSGYVVHYSFMKKVINWLNKHHFDYRGLIPNGLALEAKEGMYEKE